MSKRAWLAAGLIVLAAAAFHLLAWGSADRFASALDKGDTLLFDFTRHLHPMGRVGLEAEAPLPKFFYAPLGVILLAPFGALPLPAAAWAWGAALALGLLLLILPPARYLLRESGGAGLPLLYLALVLFSHPVAHDLRWGNISVLVTAAVLGAFLLQVGGRSRAGGLLLALPAAVKLYPGVFLLPFLVRQERRFLLWAGTGLAAGLVLLPVLLLGPADTHSFYRSLAHQLRMEQEVGAPSTVNSQFLLNVLGRWWPAAAEGWAGAAALLAALAVLVGGCLLIRRSPLPPGRSLMLSFAWLSLTLPLWVATSWPHYLAFLPFCQALLLLEAGRSRSRARFPAAALGLLSALVSSLPFFLLFPGWAAYAGWGMPLLADLLLLAAFALFLLFPGPVPRLSPPA